MEPEFEYHLKRNYELRIVILFLIVLLLFLGSYTQKKHDENNSLKASMDLLEFSLEQQKEQNQQKIDSLQEHIQQQDQLLLQLKDTLGLLERQRLQLKTRTDENKAAIRRIHDADSLRDVVAEHYR